MRLVYIDVEGIDGKVVEEIPLYFMEDGDENGILTKFNHILNELEASGNLSTDKKFTILTKVIDKL
jgi:hypothetical protein